MSETLFNVSNEEIDTLIKDNQKNIPKEDDLSTELAIDQELIAEFVCGICTLVVKAMVECS